MQYKTTKIVNAVPMTRLEYNEFRGWDLPENENGSDDGFLIETIGGMKNTPTYNGFVQWLPIEQFKSEYRSFTKLDFSGALDALKQGACLTRANWSGKGLHIKKVDNLAYSDDVKVHLEPAFVIADGYKYNTWVASVSDLLADDWYIVGE